MLRVMLAEDEREEQEKLCEFIARFAKETGESCPVDTYDNGMSLLEAYQPGNCDLILLDVEMPLLNGIETAREVRKVDTSVMIIFITNMAQYALKGYEVDALDYVLKPLSYYSFALKLKKTQRILRERSQPMRLLPFEGEMRLIPLSSILYVEVADHKLCYHTYEGISEVTGSMKILESELREHHFVRCNNCYLVNLIHVRKITNDTVWVEDEPLKISRPRKKEFMNALSAYYGGGGR